MNPQVLVNLFILCYITGVRVGNCQTFEVEYQWSVVNYTWESQEVYNDAIATKRYIPGKTAIAGIKIYKDKIYLAMPRICEGTPVTLGYITADESTPKVNPLVTPFPDWETNDLTNHTCDKLENVQSMEIDKNGIMWVLDGTRQTASAKCPPRLVLYDLNNNGSVVLTYDFPETVSLRKGAFLNDIVVDDRDGGFAYITEHSVIDPGLVVYSLAQNRSWKLRDPSLFAEVNASNISVDNVVFPTLAPVDGIALSQANQAGPRTLYYCSLAGFNLYGISTDILKDEELVAAGEWRRNVSLIGAKQSQSDGMVVDSTGALYYGLLPLYGVGRWRTNTPFATKEIVDQNPNMIWTDSFGFDDQGYLYLLTNNIHKYFVTECNFDGIDTDVIKFRIFKYYTGTHSYLY